MPCLGGALLGVALASGLAGQAVPWRGVLVIRLGTDTVGLERLSLAGDSLDVTSVWRAGGTSLLRYRAMFGADDRLASATWTIDYGASRPMDRGSLALRDGAYRLEVATGDSVRVAVRPDSVPILPWPTFAAEYLAVARRLQLHGRDSLRFVWFLGVGQPLTPGVVRRLPDGTWEGVWMVSVFGESRRRWRIDAEGMMTSISTEPTHWDLEWRPDSDIDSLAGVILAQDGRSGGLGSLSPRDTAIGRVGTARLVVDYGAPSRRGRAIFGGVVPWNRVWRAGANQATHLSLDADLLLGGTLLRRGTYTLFVVPVPPPDAWTLIVNGQTGQWGTMYDSTSDVARIPLALRRATEPVERLTYAFERQGGDLVLRIARDTLSTSVVVGRPH
jgi:hypothetical protein